MNHNRDVYDITIIGAGPVGLYALYYAGLRKARCKLIEALDHVGGGLKVLYPEKYIYDVAGFPRILAKDIVDQFEEQARAYGNPIVLGERVDQLRVGEDGLLELETAKKIHFSKTVIICAGMGAFVPRKLHSPSVEAYEKAGVFYYVKDKERFRDKRVLIVGGGDSAVDNALLLEPVAKEIMLIHRNDRFRAFEDSVEQLKVSTVKLHYPFWEIEEVYGEEWVERVRIVNTFTREEESFPVDMIVLNLGFLTNLKPLKKWGLELDMNAVKVDEHMETNIPNVYAAGDIVNHPGKLKLISTGTGEAAIAVNFAIHTIYPTRKIEPGHSSHMKPPSKQA